MYELWNINCKTERDVWAVKYKLQAWAWCMSCALRPTVCISQLIHYAQAYSLYFTANTLRSGLQFVFHNSYITLRSLSVMYELWNINCKPERDVWVVKYKLLAWGWCMSWFVFHNSYITLRLRVYISQLIHCAQAYSLYFTTHTSRSGLQFIFHNSYITLRLTVCISSVMYELWNTNCKPDRNVWVVKYKL
jgi:hypothetical protein